MITKQQLENAARAMGCEIVDCQEDENVLWVKVGDNLHQELHLLTNKSDLMDLMLALDISHRADGGLMECRLIGTAKFKFCEIIDDNKHAALAEAVVSVASQIWESKNG